MVTRKFISLLVVSTVILLATAMANANDVEVKAGNVRVSVTEDTVNVYSPSRKQPPSLLERLRIWRHRNSRLPSTSTSNTSNNCQTVNSSYRSTRTSNSGNGVVESSSSSSSTVCN
jgi:hypothetical protein